MGATRHIRAGEHVTCVPKSCWLTRKDYSAEVAKVTKAEIRICDDSSKLAIHIAREMHASDSSKFGPYFDATHRPGALYSGPRRSAGLQSYMMHTNMQTSVHAAYMMPKAAGRHSKRTVGAKLKILTEMMMEK